MSAPAATLPGKRPTGLPASDLLVDLVRESLLRRSGGATIVVNGVVVRFSETDMQL
jgi:hypothetical protein